MASIVVAGDTSGTVTLAAPAVSGTTTLTLPTTSGTIVTTSGAQTIEFADGSASTPSITNSGDTNTGMFFPAADTIAFAEGGVESMRIDSSGNVGIGTTSPTLKFQVNGQVGINTGTTPGANGSGIAIYASDFPRLSFRNSTTGDANTDGLQIYMVDNDVSYNLLETGYQRWFTGNAERMRIDSSGNVNIGQSSAFGAGIRTTIKAADTSSQSLALISAVTSGTGTLQYLVDGSNDVCGFIGINATANTTSYNTSSDYRLKENIVPMTGALDKVQALKPVFWNWKHAPEIIGQGFIAHELQTVIPDAVSGEKDAVDEEGNPKYQGVDTSFLVATLTAAIQEQQTIIETLKADIAELKAKVK